MILQPTVEFAGIVLCFCLEIKWCASFLWRWRISGVEVRLVFSFLGTGSCWICETGGGGVGGSSLEMVVGRGCTGVLLQGACGARVLINPNLLHASSLNPGNPRNVVWGPPALEFHPLTSNPRSRKNTNQTLLPIGRWSSPGSRSGVVGRLVQCAANSRGPVEPEAHRGREAAPVDDEAATQQQQQQQSYDEKAKKKRPRNRKGERTVYLLAAVASSIGFTALAAAAVYYRFVWQMQVQTSLSLSLSVSRSLSSHTLGLASTHNLRSRSSLQILCAKVLEFGTLHACA